MEPKIKVCAAVLLDTGRTGEESAAVGWPTTRRAPARVEAPAYVSDSDVLYFVRLFEVKPHYLFPEFDLEEHIGAAVRRLLSRKITSEL